MSTTTFSGPVTSTAGFVGNISGNITATTLTATNLTATSGTVTNLTTGNDGFQLPTEVTFAVTAGGANTVLVDVLFACPAAQTFRVIPVMAWLSDSATGQGLSATTPSGSFTTSLDGNVLSAMSSNKLMLANTDETGRIILSITDTAKTQYYVTVAILNMGCVFVQRVLDSNYG
jgi:hypothetical protein